MENSLRRAELILRRASLGGGGGLPPSMLFGLAVTKWTNLPKTKFELEFDAVDEAFQNRFDDIKIGELDTQ